MKSTLPKANRTYILMDHSTCLWRGRFTLKHAKRTAQELANERQRPVDIRNYVSNHLVTTIQPEQEQPA